MLTRYYWFVAGALVVYLAVVQIASVRQESQTFDEACHLAAGYSYIKVGDYRMNPEHPPLGKILAALPLTWLDLKPVTTWDNWTKGDEFEFGRNFLYSNTRTFGDLLFRGRLVTVGLSLLLAVILFLWTRATYGVPAALIALTFYCFDPNITAHGRYITTDLIASLTIFAACIAWARYLEEFRFRHLAFACVLFGVALVSKYSTAILVPIFAITFAIRASQVRRGWRTGLDVLAASATGIAAALILIAIAYWPETLATLRHQRRQPREGETISAFDAGRRLADVVDERTGTGRLLKRLGKRFRMRAHTWFVGLNSVASHNIDGQDTYLLGMYSNKGWWYYFPVAFAVKSPSAIVLAVLSMLIAALVTAHRRRRQALNAAPGTIMLVVAPVVYLGASMASNLNLGIRHLLPIYPFLFAAIAVFFVYLLRAARARVIVPILMAVLVIESIGIFPHYLAFFNTLAGGPKDGPEYLLDSNIDWGQDVPKLKKYMDQHGLSHVCLAYFGMAGIADYGIGESPVPHTDDPYGRSQLDCVVVIGATLLHDLYIPRGSYQWLRNMTPVERIGYSMYVYDMRKKRP